MGTQQKRGGNTEYNNCVGKKDGDSCKKQCSSKTCKEAKCCKTVCLTGRKYNILKGNFEGVPPPYDKKKKMAIPSALKVLRLKAGRRFCSLGRLGHEVGWKYQDIVAALEAKRKVKGEAFYKANSEVAKDALLKDAKIAKRIAPYQKIIEGYGYA